jgi:nucleoside-diphosphate kinase
MALERTLAIAKPDAVAAGHAGTVISRIETEGFRIVALRMARLSKEEAEGFYHVHRERPFFPDLVRFMTSGPVILMCLEREGAIARWRDVMGPTDPAKAADGTLRKQVGTNIERNGTHGSDAPDTAAFEVGYFFRGMELR